VRTYRAHTWSSVFNRALARGLDHGYAAYLADRWEQRKEKKEAEKLRRETAVIPDDWTPTAESVNALPEPLRRYICDLETRCDPAGDVRTIASLREQRDSLVIKLREGRS
jgi:hypothetical protein